MRVLIASFLMFATSLAGAQTRLMPSDVDLKSAYCLKVKQLQQDFINSTAAAATSESEGHQMLRKMARDHNSDVNRLQSYLLPKISSLDVTALIAATNRAEADMKEVAETSNVCSPKCSQFIENGTLTNKWRACMDSCDAEYPAKGRVYACRSVNWLPF
jgi:gamma-glutamyl:cysteine ligase YbdK (ATP-grasp superfamily)